MQPLYSQVALLVITMSFFVWRVYTEGRVRRDRVLRERVAYMLWVAADCMDPRVRLAEVD